MLRIFLTILLVLIPYAPSQAAEDGNHAAVRIVPERTAVGPGETILVAIEQTIDPGWHTYWKNPGDSGTAPVIEWTLPPGFTAGDIRWPPPKKILIESMGNYGYEGTVTLLQEITASHDMPPGPVVLKMEIGLLVCSDICIPEQSAHEFTLNDPANVADNGALIDAAYAGLPDPFVWDIAFRESDGQLVLTAHDTSYGLTKMIPRSGMIDLIPDDWGIIDNAEETDVEITESSLILRQKRGDRKLDGFETLEGLVVFTADDGSVQSFAFTALPDPAWRPVQQNIPDAYAPIPPTLPQHATITFPVAILFALLGGLILNLMPCVFPVLSLKALKLCRLSEAEPGAARAHGLFYTAGILVCFAVFAILMSALRSAGAGWGFQLQNPAFVLILTYLLFLIGLNLSGFFEIGGRMGGTGARLTQGEGHAATFFSGVLAAIVATPCTAPFMAAAVGFALTQGFAVSFAIFMALGFGLAFPYLALSFVPALRGVMPKPGAWMEVFRQFLAFPMFASAAWLAWVYGQQTGGQGALAVLLGCVAVAGAVWLWRMRRVVPGILALFLVIAAFLPLQTRPPQTMEWTPFTTESFAKLEAGNDPLFVNMTADWCITCKVNERIALETNEMKTLFSERKTVRIKGDWTRYDPEITAYLARFGRNGVPLYVYYGPRGDSGQRPQPVVLPQLLTPGIVREAIEGKETQK